MADAKNQVLILASFIGMQHLLHGNAACLRENIKTGFCGKH
jgi:hypothetical protein